ncbi:MAG TPA: class I adenylate-forming enzyme family protein [Acidimicrobiales bacterium]|nr:class I adenylate-forming enzyme family protein [Acidimicrobiales bacterium]
MPTFFGPPRDSEQGLGALTIAGLLEESAARHPDREAICFSEDGLTTRWTYGTLLAESRQLAKALVADGIGKGTRVALLMGNRPQWVQVAFGVAMAGGVLVPVNTLFESPEIEYVLRHSDTAVVLHQESLLRHPYGEQLRSFEASLPFLRARHCLHTPGYDAFLEAGKAVSDEVLDRRLRELSPTDDALIVYTSGTTGRPKGVVHMHRAPAIQSWRFAVQLRLDPTVRVWSAFPFFWTAGFCMVMGATLAAGGCLVLQEAFDAGQAMGLIERERVTTAYAWPHQSAALEAHPDWLSRDFSSLWQVDGFSALSRHPTVQANDSWSPRAAYGLTETFTIVSSVPADTSPAERQGHEGTILPGNAIRIVDPDTGRSLPAGAAGEIHVKGPTLMRGYLKVAPEEVFDPDSYFPTGDAGYVDEAGRLHWTGRMTELIKTGGANVSPVEIENELLQHPGLHSARAVGVEHPTLGEEVVLCAVVKPGIEVTAEELKEFLRGKLASYKLPRHVLFFREEDLVLTGNAKIKVDDLRALARARLTGSASC